MSTNAPEPAHNAKAIDGGQVKKRRRRAAGGGAQDDCFACRKRATPCDRKRPYCSQCIDIGKECSGYKTTLTWGVGVASRGKLRGMSLPVMNQESDKASTQASSPALHTRRPSTISRLRQESVSEAGSATRARRTSRPSFTSNPIQVRPGIPTATLGAQQSLPTTGAWYPTSLSNVLSSSLPSHAGLQRLQTDLGSYKEDRGYSDSASSTGSFFDGEFHTPLEYMSSLPDHHLLSPPLQESLPDLEPIYFNTLISDSQAALSQQETAQTFISTSLPEHVLYTFEPSSCAEETLDELDQDLIGFDQCGSSLVHNNFYNPFTKMLPRTQFLLQYYNANVCPFLVTVDGPQNPYRMFIMQMAIQSEGLQNALSALALNNMRMRRLFNDPAQPQGEIGDVDSGPDAEETMYKQASVNQLNQQLAHPMAAQDESVLATLLILSLYHCSDSGFSKFRTQLAGIQKLLSMRQTHQRSMFANWVEMFFMWFDAMTSAVNDREMEMKGEQLDMLEHSGNLGSLEQFSGCDGRLFRLIARLGRLNLLAQGRPVSGGTDNIAGGIAPTNVSAIHIAQPQKATQAGRSTRSLDPKDYEHLDGNGWGSTVHMPMQQRLLNGRPAPDARTDFWNEWHDIRVQLQDWQANSSVSSSVFSSDLDNLRFASEQCDMIHISEAFRHAALLYTERLAHPLLPSASQQFQQHVDQALLHISALPVASCVNKFLLFVLFVIGTECVDPEHRAVIRARCIEVQRESGFYNNRLCLEVLEGVWADSDVGHSDAVEMKARRRDSERIGAAPCRQAFRWRIAMDRADGEYLVV